MLSNESLGKFVPTKVVKNDRRYQVCLEMLETERNYLNHLELMIEVCYPIVSNLLTFFILAFQRTSGKE